MEQVRAKGIERRNDDNDNDDADDTDNNDRRKKKHQARDAAKVIFNVADVG